jgi:hypothetical protein
MSAGDEVYFFRHCCKKRELAAVAILNSEAMMPTFSRIFDESFPLWLCISWNILEVLA